MNITTSGIFPNKEKAERVIMDLRDEGISDDDISCVYMDKEGDIHDVQTREKIGGGAVTGATAGAVIGTLAGLIVANGILPGVGTLFVAGPIATALGFTGAAATAVAGAATGIAAGGLIGALTSLGIDKDDAQLYETHVERGDYLVISKGTSDDVRDIFVKNNASEIRQYSETE